MPDALPGLYADCATCDPEFRVYHLPELRWTPDGRLTCRSCWEEGEDTTEFSDLPAPVATLWPQSREAPPEPWVDLVRQAGRGGLFGSLAQNAMIGRVVRLKSHPLDAMTVTAAPRDMSDEVEVAFMVEGRPHRTLLPMAALADWSADDL